MSESKKKCPADREEVFVAFEGGEVSSVSLVNDEHNAE